MNKQNSNPTQTAALRAVSMPLFPTLGSIQEVMDLAESKLPITSKNEITSLLLIMQNTVLKVLSQQYQGKD